MAKVGDKIRIICMDDTNGTDIEAQRYAGKTGTIEYIDCMGQLHGTWGSLAVIPGTDVYKIIR